MTIGIIVSSMYFANKVLKEANSKLSNIDCIDFRRGRIITMNKTEVLVLSSNTICKSQYAFDELLINDNVPFQDKKQWICRVRRNGCIHSIYEDIDTIVDKIGEV